LIQNISLMPPSAITIGFDITQKERGRIFTNFQGFRKILEAEHFNYEEFNEFPITSASLQKYKLLIFACPDSSKFKPEEIQALLSYVSDGGKLLLLNHAGGDQGRRTNLGEITSPLGIIFNNDEVLDPVTNLDVESYPLIKDFIQHPILQGIDNICYRIGCSLDVTANAIPLALTANSAETPQKAVLGLIFYGRGHILVSGSYEMFQDEVKGGITHSNNAKLVTNIAQWLTSDTPAGTPETLRLKKSPPPSTSEIDHPLQTETITINSSPKSTKRIETQFDKLFMEFQQLKTELQRFSMDNSEIKEKFRIIELNLSNFSTQTLSDLAVQLQDLNNIIKTHSQLFKEIQQSVSLLDDRISNIEAQLEQKLKQNVPEKSLTEESLYPLPPIITAATFFAQKTTSQNLKVSAEINAYKQMLNMLDAYYQNGTLPEDIYEQKRLKFEKKLEELQ